LQGWWGDFGLQRDTLLLFELVGELQRLVAWIFSVKRDSIFEDGGGSKNLVLLDDAE
jgi:hypothetical protein